MSKIVATALMGLLTLVSCNPTEHPAGHPPCPTGVRVNYPCETPVVVAPNGGRR